MSTDAKLQFLREIGQAQIQHDSHVPFLTHLVGTRRLLQQWGARDALCEAAFFHSVYGTEYFTPESGDVIIPERSAVRDLIGTDAEEIAWLWCSIERKTLDVETGSVLLWRDGVSLTLPRSRVEDIATLWAADTVEQLERMNAEEREFARGVHQLAARMLPRARVELEGVLAARPR